MAQISGSPASRWMTPWPGRMRSLTRTGTADAADPEVAPVTANPWLVPVTALRRQTGARREEQRAGRVGELSVVGSVVPASAEVVADLRLDSISGGIEVTASILAP